MDFNQGLTEDDIFTAENGSQVDVKNHLRDLRQQFQAAEQRVAEAEHIIISISGIISEAWGDYDGGNLPNGIQEIFDVLAERDQASAAWLEAGDK